MTPEQCRHARALLGWSRDRLGAMSGTGSHVILRYEVQGVAQDGADKTPGHDRLSAIRIALEQAGVVFTNGDAPDVKLKRAALTPDQCRQARGLLGWSRERLGAVSGVPYSAVGKLERGISVAQDRALSGARTRALQVALEAAGVEFTDGEASGVRLRMAHADPGTREGA